LATLAISASVACAAFVASDAPDHPNVLDADTGLPIDANMVDRGPDAGEPACSLGFCACESAAGRHHFLCSDFDEPSTRFAGWTLATPKGSVSAVEDASVSPPGSVRTFVPASTGGASAALTSESFPSIPSHIHAEFDVLTCSGAPGTDSDFLIAQVVQDDIKGLSVVVNSYEKADLWVSLDGSPGSTEVFGVGVMPTGVWSHVVIDAKLSDTDGSVRVSVDDAGVSLLNHRTLGPQPDGGSNMYFWLGPYTFGTTPACATNFDNVWVDVE
jgi:hypothetical protein